MLRSAEFIDICPNSEERSYADAGRCMLPTLNLGKVAEGGTRICTGICMASGICSGIGLAFAALKDFFTVGTAWLVGSSSFWNAKRHIKASFPALWSVQLGRTIGICFGGIGPEPVAAGLGDKGIVNV